MPSRETFVLLPAVTPLLMYVVFVPFALAFLLGFIRLLRPLDIQALVRNAPGWPAAALKHFVVDVFLQRRVARERRGWPHLGIFFSYCVLTLGTLLVALDWDILRPLGRRLLQGAFYLGYEAVMDFFGLVFLGSALVALVWRVRRRIGSRGIQVQYLALLGGFVYMGLTGFLLEGLRLTLHPVPWGDWSFVGARVADSILRPLGIDAIGPAIYTALWWSHAIVAFGLIAAIPFSIFVHAVSAPLNVLVSPGRPRPDLPAPFDLRELMESGDFDVKVGASTLVDLGASPRLSLIACTNCGRCDEVCPATITGAALSPRRLVQNLREAAVAGRTTVDLLAGTVDPAEIWACTTCAACVEACPVSIRPAELSIPFRRELVARQQIDAQQAEMLANLGRSSNPYGAAIGDRGALAGELGLPTPAEAPAADYLYWIGCAGAYDERIKAVVRATVEIAHAGGLTIAALGAEELCTGDPARRLGEEGLFQHLALQNIETLQRNGVKRIVTHCAHCFNTLKNEYPRFGGQFDVVHHTELIAQLVQSGRIHLDGSAMTSVAIHDSCYVGRYNGIFDAPRDALEAIPGLQVIEMVRNRERSFCCGAGGAQYWYRVPSQEKAGVIRMREASATGAAVVAAECPFCIKMLEDAARAEAAGNLLVKDVAEIVASALVDPRKTPTVPASARQMTATMEG